ncbi:hypothetical protein RF55_6306 [Lasius niger]|uniref:Uncharacterized protein n=1 Tax=Lasius niger TaxID=67767 RepID=A0A0J7KTF5_LASNI|nr:hypothetical protein RF55_6306 [Lasius niger]
MSGLEQRKRAGGRSWKLNRRPPYSLEVEQIGDRFERVPDDQPEMLPAELTAEQTTMEETVELPVQSQKQIQPDEERELQEEKPMEPELDNPAEERNNGDEESVEEKGGQKQAPPPEASTNLSTVDPREKLEMEETQLSQRAESVAKEPEVEPTQPAEESLPTVAEKGVAAEEPGAEEGSTEEPKSCDKSQSE